ncbi:MAG: DUF1854 domain-containing protein [Oscillospiraceae bacterium]|nr:DUF1854 domain-containing protein [Oscillospiraceae bacterium]
MAEEITQEQESENLFGNERKSIALTPENSKFTRSKGGLISLELTNNNDDNGESEKEFFERIVIFRCFPITNPDEFLSVREPDSKKMGRGKEIGMVRYMKDFPEDQRKLFLEELDRRYFSPEITKINSVKEKFGYTYWEVVTNAGSMTFILSNPFSNIRSLEDGRVFIHDIDGNSFQIKEPSKLDSNSFKKIEIYV